MSARPCTACGRRKPCRKGTIAIRVTPPPGAVDINAIAHAERRALSRRRAAEAERRTWRGRWRALCAALSGRKAVAVTPTTTADLFARHTARLLREGR